MDRARYQQVPFFRGFTAEDLDRVLQYATEGEYSPGEVVFHQGDNGRELYLVLSGSIKFEHVSPEGKTRSLPRAGFGELFGELAFLQPQPRYATARAAEPSVLLVFLKPDIQKLLDLYPTLAAAFYHAIALELSRRLRR